MVDLLALLYLLIFTTGNLSHITKVKFQIFFVECFTCSVILNLNFEWKGCGGGLIGKLCLSSQSQWFLSCFVYDQSQANSIICLRTTSSFGGGLVGRSSPAVVQSWVKIWYDMEDKKSWWNIIHKPCCRGKIKIKIRKVGRISYTKLVEGENKDKDKTSW